MAVPANRFHQRFCVLGGVTGDIGVYGMRTGIHNPFAFRCLRRAGARVYGRGHRSHFSEPISRIHFMKQSAAKTLGVAALGAAFAATGAGAANAAPAVPDATGMLGSVTSALPAQNVSQALPGAE